MKTFICLLFIACLPAYAQDYIEWSKPFNYSVHDLRYSPDEKTVAVANADTITILSADDGHIISALKTRDNIEQFVFTPDGNSVIVRYLGKRVVDIWNLSERKLKDSLLMKYSPITQKMDLVNIALSPNGELLAAAFVGLNLTSVFVVIEVKTGKELLLKEDKAYSLMQFTHDGKQLVVIRSDQYIETYDPLIEIYDTENFSMWSHLLSEKKIKNLYVNAMDISFNDSLLAIATTQGTNAIWLMDLRTKTITSPISTGKNPDIRRMKFYQNSKYIFTGVGGGLNLTAYSIKQPPLLYIFKDSFAGEGGISGIDCSQEDGSIIYASGIVVVKCNDNWQLPVGIHDPIIQTDNILYPNPTTGQITIKTTYSLITPINISIADVTGRQYQQNINTSWEGNNFIASFNTNMLPSGKYYILLKTNSSSRSFNFIKE